MERKTISRRETTFFSDLANAINDNQESLLKYISQPFSIEALGKQVEVKQKKYTLEQRSVTYQVLTNQMQNFTHFSKVQKNLELFKQENTYTITAGHQLNMYGGPLYTIYKVLDAVKLTERLQQEYPDYNFIPVFWMATEDHDFEEINHLYLFNEKIEWTTSQKGPVGRFSLENIEGFKSKLLERFTNNPDFSEYLNSFYRTGSLTEATREFLMELFGDFGVLIIDADDAQLKFSFLPILTKELEDGYSEALILKTIKQLEEDGYHGQATPRPVNLFYVKDGLRERIIPEGDSYIFGQEEKTKNDLLIELRNNPECFSPNVVMRPLYQEYILPNLCYIGGGGEMAYWLELKAMFEAVEIPFPLIKVRNSVQLFDSTTLKRIEQLELKIEDVFLPIDETKKKFIFENAEEELDFTSFDNSLKNMCSIIEESITTVDVGLKQYAESEIARLQKQMENIQQKLVRHQKKKFEESMKKIDGIYSRLFPENGLQERYENVIPYLFKYGRKDFLQMIYDLIDSEEESLILGLEE